MANLIASHTRNPKYSIFFNARSMKYINDINTELLEIIQLQNLNYWAIDRTLTDGNDIYGEAEKKISKQPVQFYAWIMLDRVENKTGSFTTEQQRFIEIYCQKDRMTEIGIEPKIGDYLEWDNGFFEINYSGVPKFVFGMPQTKIGCIYRAYSVRTDVFNPRSNLDEYSNEITADAENPY